jgi:hypothetical protein
VQESRRWLLLWALFGVVAANYVAQVVYYFHLYYPARLPLGTITLGATFVWFLVGFVLLARGAVFGYWLLLTYLLAMVGFYLANMLNQMLHGFGPFFHLREPDPVLFVVFAIGYLNMLVGAYYVYVLVRHFRALIGRVPATSADSQAA